MITLDSEKWVTSVNIKQHSNTVYKRLLEISFIVPKPDYQLGSEWTPECEAAGARDQHMIRCFLAWKEAGLEGTTSMDESELFTNQSGSCSKHTAKAEKTVIAIQIETDKVGVTDKESKHWVVFHE